jgi:flagellar basal-body rod modification protein FlgD
MTTGVTTNNPFAAIDSAYAANAAAATPNPSAKSTGALGQQDFLNLMLAQLKNQDPTKPMDSSAFLGQLAQFSTVQGLTNLQTSFSGLASSMNSNQSLQAAALVGHSVLAPGGSAMLNAGGSISGAVDLPSTASDVTVNVYDTSGQLVQTVPLGTQAAGLASFQWDGLTSSGTAAAPGVYIVSANALVGGQTQAVNTLVTDKVNSVNIGANGAGLTLNLSGLGSVDFSTVREIM